MKEIREIVDWLIRIEDLAYKFYTESAEYFTEDTELRAFLLKSALDEAAHSNIVRKAASHLNEIHIKDIGIDLDPEAIDRLEAPIFDGLLSLKEKGLSKEELLIIIARTELSEWNDIFIYIIDKFKDRLKEFRNIAITIESHRRNIIKFLRERAEGSEELRKLSGLPPVWKEKILIVEDDPEINILLKVILQDEAEISTAENGVEALELMDKDYFKVVLSDVNMPVMDGIELFEKAKSKHPGIENRFVYFTGNPINDILKFFRENKIDYLIKPASVTEIRAMVDKILYQEESVS